MDNLNIKVAQLIDNFIPAITNDKERESKRQELFDSIYALIYSNCPAPGSLRISNVIDLIHLTIVKKNDINDICFEEIKSIERKIKSGTLTDYIVNDKDSVWDYICDKIKA